MTKKVTLVLTSLVVPKASSAEQGGAAGVGGASGASGAEAGTGAGSGIVPGTSGTAAGMIFVVLLIVGLFVAILYAAWHYAPQNKLRGMAQKVSWHANKGLAEPWVDAAKKKRYLIALGFGVCVALSVVAVAL